ncbi:hypothetical protein ACHAXT_008275 [Thalassiosira profunda]
MLRGLIPRRVAAIAAASNVQLQRCQPQRRRSSSSPSPERVVILGGGMAGLSTARYLLRHAQSSIDVTLIDSNTDLLPAKPPTSGASYVEELCEQNHNCIPSRRNGNVICPSLTVPWTARSLWAEAFWPGLKSAFGNSEGPSASISFDWPSLMRDRRTKFLLGRPEHQSNQSILQYHMRCLDDPSDELVQSIDYGRFSLGTKLLDGIIKEMDSSGDIGLFCRGLLDGLLKKYGDRFTVIPGEDAVKLEVEDGVLQGVTTMDQNGNATTREADKVVVALGVNSAQLCRDINVPCPVYPAKGHLVTVSSTVDSKYNLTLEGGVGYAAPMAHIDSDGRRLYRLSGFVDFTPSVDLDYGRVEALLEAARQHLPDLELIDTSACHRPISADDRPLIGATARYKDLYLCTGFGSRGWSIGLGSGKLLASQMLGLECEIDPAPYLPSRFRWA